VNIYTPNAFVEAPRAIAHTPNQFAYAPKWCTKAPNAYTFTDLVSANLAFASGKSATVGEVLGWVSSK